MTRLEATSRSSVLPSKDLLVEADDTMRATHQKSYKAAVIGTGFAREHLRLLRASSGVTVEWLMYKQNRNAATSLAAEYDIPHVTDNLSDVVASAVDFAVVVSPVNSHLPLCSALLRGGKMVVCDKPLAMSLEEATELTRIAEASRLPAMVFFQWRFNRSVQQLKALCDAGTLGRVRCVRAEFYHDFMADPQLPWTWRNDVAQSSLGAFADMGVHLVDLIQWLTGDDIVVTSAAGRILQDHRMAGGVSQKCNAEDLALVGFELRENHGVGTIVTCRAFPSRRAIRLLLMGEHGGVELSIDPSTAAGRLETFGLEAQASLSEHSENPYVHWLAHIEGRSEVPSFIDGLRAQRVMSDVSGYLQGQAHTKGLP
jgi:predicted dehydrogenase